jgi:hypothetical protein
VVTNDSDPNNDPLTFAIADSGTAILNGTLTFNSNGSFTYLPNNGFFGQVFYTYYACDAEFCDIATVFITIVPITISGNVFNDANGICDNTIGGTGINSAGSQPLYAYLVHNGGNVYERVQVQAGGAFTFAKAAQNTTYTVRISTISVDSGLAAPAHGLGAGWLPVGDSYGTGNSAGSGIEAGTPDLVISMITTTLNVSGVNFGIQQIPVALDDTFTMVAGETLTKNVLFNDSDPEGSSLAVTLVSGPSGGTLNLGANGIFTYTNATPGTYTFVYKACDPANCGSIVSCDNATVTIYVLPCVDPPVRPGTIIRN